MAGKYDVQVIRYVRPTFENTWDDFSGEDYYRFSNLYGITAVFDIDYELGIVLARWSVCNGDNFSKEVGVNLAKNSSNREIITLSDVELHGGLVYALAQHLKKNHHVKRNGCIFENLLNLFIKASRNHREIAPEYF